MFRLAYPYGTPETSRPVLGFQGEPQQVLPQLAALGYTGVELFVRDPQRLDVPALAAAVAEAGLAVVQLGTGPVVNDDGLTFTDPDAAVRRQALERARRIVRMAARLGSHMNVGSLRGPIHEDHPRRSRRWMAQTLTAVCEEAGRHGGRVVLEPQNRAVVNNLNSMDEAMDFIQELGLANLYVMLDIFHVLTESQSLSHAFAVGGDRIIHLHVADRDRAIPGQGGFDFRQVVRELQRVQHPGHVTVEIRQEPSSAAAAQAARRYLLNLWQDVAS